MNKSVKSYRTMEALLDIDFDRVPGWEEYIKLYQSLQGLEESEG